MVSNGIVTIQKITDITLITLAYFTSLLWICASCVIMAAAGAAVASSTIISIYSASSWIPIRPRHPRQTAAITG